MTSPVVAVVAAVLREHQFFPYSLNDRCTADDCVWFGEEDEFPEHVAAAVVEALALREDRTNSCVRSRKLLRFVTEWVAVDGITPK